jgi:protein CpxP
MPNLTLTAGLLSLALGMSLSAIAQSSTTTSPQPAPPTAAQPQDTPAQSAPSQAAPDKTGPQNSATSGEGQSAPSAGDDPLLLTEEQKAKLRPILIEENQKMEALRNDTTMTQDQKIAKANEIRRAASPKIKAILTPEQLRKLTDLQEKSRQTPPADTATPPATATPPQK